MDDLNNEDYLKYEDETGTKYASILKYASKNKMPP